MPRDLRLLAAATALSATGDMLLVVVLALRVHELTGSGFAVAAQFGALMVPIVLLAPLAGRLVDRVETRRLLLLVSLAQAGVATGLVFADSLLSILALTALLASGAAVAGPAEAALVPAAVPADALARANGRIETARYVGFTAGPLLAGVLTAAGGTDLGLAANAASFGVVALVAALMHVRRVPSPSISHEAAGGGLTLLTGDPVLRVALTAAVGALLLISGVMTAEVFYVRDVVGAGEAGYALVFAGWMAGMVIGAVGIASADQGAARGRRARRAPRPRRGRRHGRAVGGVRVRARVERGRRDRPRRQERAAADADPAARAGRGARARVRGLQRRPQHGRAGRARHRAGCSSGALGAQPAVFIAGLGPVIAAALGLAVLGYRPRRAAALSRKTAFATSGGSSSRSSSARQASGSNIG